MAQQQTFTELTLRIQKRIGREDTLLLLKRAGDAHRACHKEFAPMHILLMMEARLNNGFTAQKIAALSTGKLVKLTRSWVRAH